MAERLDHRFCVAPMLGATDRHFRYFARQLTKRAMLYTELVNIQAITTGKYTRFADFDELCPPVALQLAGCEPKAFAESAEFGQHWGFNEININLGCPSPRGVDGRFGACLMLEPELMAECVRAMVERVQIPVTVKCRLGVGNDYPLERFIDFVGQLHAAGCDTFIIHARGGNIEWMNTKQNRSLLALRYDDVYRVKEIFPDLEIIINGNIATLEQCREHLNRVDGVMMGRVAYHNLAILSRVDEALFGEAPQPVLDRGHFLRAILPYIEREMKNGLYLSHFTRHLLGLYHGERGARPWRQYLTEHTNAKDAQVEEIFKAYELAESVARR